MAAKYANVSGEMDVSELMAGIAGLHSFENNPTVCTLMYVDRATILKKIKIKKSHVEIFCKKNIK